MQKQPPRRPGRTLSRGALGTIILIPLIPLLIPLIIIWYVGQMADILLKPKGDDE